MTDFTRENPFEFGGVKVWRQDGPYPVRVTSYPLYLSDNMSEAHVAALHAFIEAERDSWHYTNDDHTEARKGRWVVKEYDGGWAVEHDDFDGHLWGTTTRDRRGDAAETWNALYKCDEVLSAFLEWHAARNQPSEPTGLGAVVEVGGMRFTRHDDGNWWQGAHGWKWSIILDRGPVTVLSPGVES